MTPSNLVVGLVCWSGLLSGCQPTSNQERQAEPTLAIGQGIVATVGEERIATATVARIAHAESVDPRSALTRAITDARFAQAARDTLDRGSATALADRVLARALLAQVWQTARANPPTDSELDVLVQARWFELDCPESVRTVHAVVMPKNTAEESRARQIADAIHEAVLSASTQSEFMDRARAVAHGSIEVKVEALSPLVLDGRMVGPGDQRVVPEFARAAHAIAAVGAKSPVVRTEFGFHVIQLLERIPAKRFTAAERRSKLSEEVFENRGRSTLESLLKRLRSEQNTEWSRAAESLMAAVRVTP